MSRKYQHTNQIEQPSSNGEANRFQSRKEQDRQRFIIKPASALIAVDPPPFVGPVPGIVTGGCSTTVVSLPKVGKTLTLSWMTREFDADGLSVLIVSEEGERHWIRRRDQQLYTDNVNFICRPWKTNKPDRPAWEALVHEAANARADIVIFDTVPNLWCCQKENEADHVIPALMPLTEIMENGAALILSSHAAKGDKSEGMAGRGSNAIMGWVDIIVELRRTNPAAEDNLRTLNSWGKFDECPAELVIERVGHSFNVLGLAREVRLNKRLTTIKVILDRRGADAWINADGLKEEWPEGMKFPSGSQLREDLAEGWRKDLWRRQGKGVRNDPFEFSSKSSSGGNNPNTAPFLYSAPPKGGCVEERNVGDSAILPDSSTATAGGIGADDLESIT